MPRIAGPKSTAAYRDACRLFPGGVNSPVRAWKRMGASPLVIDHGEGAWVVDADGRRYCDYVLSWGPLLHGHAHPKVLKAVQQAAAKGLSFGAPTAGENRLGRLLQDAVPGLERLRLVSSGTEACMSALRVARAATGRELIIKCDGCYHGHADHLLVAAGSGAATCGHPDSAGVPAAFAERTLVVPYNDAAAVERTLKRHRRQVAALIVEPIAGNMGFVQPDPGYLAELRRLCSAHGTVLIFDEVMTGFRTAWGGETARTGITPDLVCLGKVIGGGLPAAAYGGRADLMAVLAPEGPCYQAGTLSGNPVAVAAGAANVSLAASAGFYDRHQRRLRRLIDGLLLLAKRHVVPMQASCTGTMWGYFFHDAPVRNLADAMASHTARWQTFTAAMFQHGVNLAPSPYEAAFWSSVHGPAEIAHTLAAADHALAAAARV